MGTANEHREGMAMGKRNGHADLASTGAGKLTPKQNAFKDATLDGKNPSEAYRLAYDASKMSAKAMKGRRRHFWANFGSHQGFGDRDHNPQHPRES